MSIWRERGGDGPRVRELAFAARDDAKRWAIAHQSERRNLTPEQLSYLRGLKYELEKKAEGAPKGNANNAKSQRGKSCNVERTVEKVAAESGVSPRTVMNDAAFARAVDKLDADGVLPKSDALAGDIPRRKVVEAAKAETPAEAKAVIGAEPTPAAAPKPRQEKPADDQPARGLHWATEAINALKRITPDDKFRARAFEMVESYITSNR
jgi:hypothetical protein